MSLNIAITDDLDTDRAKLADAIREYSSHAKTDCAITTYRSGEELLEAFAPGMFDLAFLDIRMDVTATDGAFSAVVLMNRMVSQ